MRKLAGTRPSKAPISAPSSSKYRVALVMKSLANEFFLTMETGAKDHQKQHAAEYDLIANGIKDEQDVTAQINIVEQMNHLLSFPFVPLLHSADALPP